MNSKSSKLFSNSQKTSSKSFYRPSTTVPLKKSPRSPRITKDMDGIDPIVEGEVNPGNKKRRANVPIEINTIGYYKVNTLISP